MQTKHDEEAPGVMKRAGALVRGIRPHEVVLAVMLGCVWAAGEQYIVTPDLAVDGRFFGSFAAHAVVFLVLLAAVRALLCWRGDVRAATLERGGAPAGGVAAPDGASRRPAWAVWLIAAVVIFVCWLPYLIALYPGTLSNDTFEQLAIYYSTFVTGQEFRLADHHPLFDTLCMGFVVHAGEHLFGSVKAGVFLYVVLQAAATSLALAATAVYARRRLRLSALWCRVLVGVYALFPLFPLLVANMSKDSFFGWVFVPFVIGVMEVCRTRGAALADRRFLIAFVVVTLLSCLTRKLGIYLTVGTLLVLIVVAAVNDRRARRGGTEHANAQATQGKAPSNSTRADDAPAVVAANGASASEEPSSGALGIASSDAASAHPWRRAWIPLVCAAALMWVVLPLGFRVVGVTSGGAQEMLSIPFQQTGLYVTRHADDMTDSEFEDIDTLLDMSTIADRYTPGSADGVKGYSNLGTTSAYLHYLQAWLAEGPRHPKTYADAFGATTAGWYTTDPIAVLFDSSWHSSYEPDVMPTEFWEHEGNAAAASALASFYEAWEATPLFNLLIATGSYVTFLPILALSVLMSRRRPYGIAALVPLAGLVAGVFVSPLSTGAEAMRYALPFVYLTPLVVSWLAYNARPVRKDARGRE